ncbi:MAG: hypothetical protein H0U70_04725 [Tatlockia sp.]|nr:hypothetical protein [Tatlockia sp.]
MPFFKEFKKDCEEFFDACTDKEGFNAVNILPYIGMQYYNGLEFFTPHKSLYNFSKTLVGVAAWPLFFGAAGTLLLIGTAVAAIVFASFLLASVLTSCCSYDLSKDLGFVSGVAFLVTFILPLVAATSLILAAITPAISLAKLVTRSGASAAQLAKDCAPAEDNTSFQPY